MSEAKRLREQADEIEKDNRDNFRQELSALCVHWQGVEGVDRLLFVVQQAAGIKPSSGRPIFPVKN